MSSSYLKAISAAEYESGSRGLSMPLQSSGGQTSCLHPSMALTSLFLDVIDNPQLPGHTLTSHRDAKVSSVRKALSILPLMVRMMVASSSFGILTTSLNNSLMNTLKSSDGRHGDQRTGSDLTSRKFNGSLAKAAI